MLINTREYKCINNVAEELIFQHNRNYLFTLNYLSSIAVTGNNPEQFLQGQLTCDINKVSTSHIQPGAICNIKGRIITLLNAILWEKNYYLILPKDLQETVQKKLNKTALFSKIKIAQENNFNIFGFYLQNANDHIPLEIHLPKEEYEFTSNSMYCCYHLINGLYIIIIKSTNSAELLNNFPSQQLRQDLAWHNLLLRNHIYEIYPNSSTLFLPHRLDLHNTNYISFTKGCFIGQEIIARTQYLAKLKHNMYLYEINTDEKLYSGQKIYDKDNPKEIGELIDYAPLGNKKYLIAASLFTDHPNEIKFAEHLKTICLTNDDKI